MLYFLILCAVILAAVLLRSHYENTHFTRAYYLYKSRKIKDNIKIVFLSDLHESVFGRENQELADAIRQENPDYILLGGDLIIGKEKKLRTEQALHFLTLIKDICPVYYTFGNHETRGKALDGWKDYISRVEHMGKIRLLNNAGVHFTHGRTALYLYGLELQAGVYKEKVFPEKLAAQNPFEKADRNEVKILLAHTPEFFETYEKWGADLVLSGHNHGGIVRLPVLGGVISTGKRLFPKYSYGKYGEKDTQMFLTAGAGTHTIRFRLFNPAEYVVLEMKKDQEE